MVPRSVPKAISEAIKSNGTTSVLVADTFLQTFGATWVILGAILDPAWRQGAPKIELFGTKSHQNLKKWSQEWGIKKYIKFVIEI